MMKIITVSNLKGGVGKTTTVVNLAYIFSRRDMKVLVVDADPQANATPFLAKKQTGSNSIRDVLFAPSHTKKYICKSRYKGIDIIRGCTQLAEDDVTDLWDMAVALSYVKDTYDVCLIDTRPAFEKITTAAYLASDLVLSPACLDKFCRDNLSLVDEYLDSFPVEYVPHWKVFASKVDVSRRAQKKIYQDLMTKHDYPFMESCVSRTADIENALEQYKPIYKHRSGSVAAKDYAELATELTGLLADVPQKMDTLKELLHRIRIGEVV